MAESDSQLRLCSHLVRLVREDRGGVSQTVLLEEIFPEGATLAAEEFYPAGAAVRIEAEDFKASAAVENCTLREDGYRVEVRFLEGVRWSPERWRPDHLYRPPARAKIKKASGGSP